MKNLVNKILNKKATIGIVGLGYVGLPLLIRFAEIGFDVIGFDSDQKKIFKLKNRKSYINHIDLKSLSRLKNKNQCNFTTDFNLIGKLDVIILCLPTPLKKNKTPDLKYIKNTIKNILPFLKKDQIISLESTTYPGCTRDLIVQKLNYKFNLGSDFFIVYSPEREDPGNKSYKIQNIPKIIGGYSHNCLYIGSLIYKKAFSKIYKVKSIEIAEFTKIFENIFRAVNISLVNELKVLSNKMHININEVIDAAATKPFGFMPFYPGPGIGGHCIPIDPIYLSWLANSYKIKTRLIDQSFEINKNTTNNVAKKIHNYFLKNKISKPSLLIIGVAYKKNIDDIRESPSLKFIQYFTKKNISCEFYDPYIKKIPKNRNFFIDKKSINLSSSHLKKFSATLISTNHENIDYEKIYKYSSIIFDSRNIYDYSDKKIIQV